MLIKEDGAGGEAYTIHANGSTNTPSGIVVIASPKKAYIARGTTQVSLNTWTHLAITHDGAMLRLYVNGVQVGTRPATGALLTTSGVLRIGGNSIWG